MVFGYISANVFMSPKSALHVYVMADQVNKTARYEWFREKAWQTGHALVGFAKTTRYT